MLTGFTNEQIVSLLDNHSLWGKRACREILGRKDEFVPLLLEFLDKIINEKNLYDCSVIDRFFPTSLLLARMRVTEAYPRLISLLSFEDDEIDFIWGDFLFMLAPYILRDTYDGNSTLLPALIENRSVSPWARKMAVSAYGVYYKNGYISREEIAAFLRHLAYDVYIGQTSYEDRLVLSGICTCVRDQQLEELIDDIKALYARGDIDKGLYGNFESYLKHYKTPHREKTDCPVDAVKELEEWGWFQEPKDDIDDDDEPYDDEIIGRNAPCPCGSGKKYKHCHGR